MSAIPNITASGPWYPLAPQASKPFSLVEPKPEPFSLDLGRLPRGDHRLLDHQAEYGKSIGRETESGDSQVDEAREAAVDFVAMTLIQPILEQMRESNAAAPPFAPTPAERQFGALADAQTARRIARASNFAIVDRIADDLRRGGSIPEVPPEPVEPSLAPALQPGRVNRVA